MHGCNILYFFDALRMAVSSEAKHHTFCGTFYIKGQHLSPFCGINSIHIYTIKGSYLGQFAITQLRCPMEKAEFSKIRKKLGKTQKQLAALLGMSLKTIHSYEQGWRSIPAHIERQLFFLLINQRQRHNQLAPCWEQKECDQKEDCPAWEFQSGHLCWFLCGTLCECTSESTYREKVNVCRSCNIFQSLID